jgi:outer membrane protein OmpA-like peptidoglycan-associated protein
MRFVVAVAALCAVAGVVKAATSPEVLKILTSDLPRASDHPLVGRYEGSALMAKTEKAFDEIKLPNGKAEGQTFDSNKKFSSLVTLQGRVTRMIYVAPVGRSSLEVATNFTDSVAAKGFEPVFRCSGDECGESFSLLKYRWDAPTTKVLGENYDHLRKLLIDAVFDQVVDVRYSLFKKSAPEGDTYIAIFAGLHQGGSFGDYSAALDARPGVLVEIVEPRAMEKKMVLVSAQEIDGDLARQGKAVFYGILFDFNKADIKPESDPQLAEMAKFLTQNPALKAFIIGHTDNKGTLDYNVNLSNRRATAVVQALATKYRIDANRLTARGLGPLAPASTNRTEDGRTKNRRVELVEQ